jgi:hypothetical protein
MRDFKMKKAAPDWVRPMRIYDRRKEMPRLGRKEKTQGEANQPRESIRQ